jgi:hypothetical protein
MKLDWAITNKLRNKQQHALNGNQASRKTSAKLKDTEADFTLNLSVPACFKPCLSHHHIKRKEGAARRVAAKERRARQTLAKNPVYILCAAPSCSETFHYHPASDDAEERLAEVMREVTIDMAKADKIAATSRHLQNSEEVSYMFVESKETSSKANPHQETCGITKANDTEIKTTPKTGLATTLKTGETGNKGAITTTSQVEMVFVPAYLVGETTNPAREFKVDSAMLKSLKSKFPNPFISHAISNVFLAHVARAFPNADDVIRVSTCTCFLAQLYVKQQALRLPYINDMVYQSALQKNKETATFVQPSSLDFQEYVLGLGQTMDHGSIYRHWAITSDLKPKAGSNGNFSVLSSRGFTPTNVGTPEVGSFDTEDNEHPKFYKSIFFRLRGKTDFSLLDANGKNYTNAMYRLFRHREPVNEPLGPGPSELELRKNQMRLLNHFPINPRLLKSCSHTPTVIPGEDGNAATRQFVADGLKTFTEDHRSLKWLLFALTFSGFSTYFYRSLVNALFARRRFVTLGTLVLSRFLAGAGVLWETIRLSAKATNHVRTQLHNIGLASAYYKLVTKFKLYRWWFKDAPIHSYGVPLSVKPGEVQFKKEWAKPGKHGRLFVSYGKSILTYGWFFSHLKQFYCHKYEFQHPSSNLPLSLEIVKSLDESCRPTRVPPKGMSCRIFSDDMEMTWYDPGSDTLFRIDIDISGCDAGNTSAMFYIMGFLMVRANAVLDPLTQSYARLTGPLRCVNPSNPKEVLNVRPKTIYQGSGCPETTFVNNVASSSILLAVYDLISRDVDGWNHSTEEDRTRLINKAAGLVGHQVSVDHRHNMEETQFLKYSPMQSVKSEWIYARNIGAIFRSLGSCDGDITAVHLGVTPAVFRNLSHAERGERFAQNVVLGLQNEPNHCVMKALRDRFPGGTKPVTDNIYTAMAHDRRRHNIPTESLITRYGSTHDEWDLFCASIRTLRHGQTVSSPIMTRVMAIDYSLGEVK